MQNNLRPPAVNIICNFPLNILRQWIVINSARKICSSVLQRCQGPTTTFQVKGLSMEMSQDAWVKQQTQQTGDRHQTRIKTSPVSGTGNCEVQESGPPQSHTATFAPIMPQYGMPIHGSGGMSRYAPPAHVPMPSHRRPAAPKPSPSQSPHARNYR